MNSSHFVLLGSGANTCGQLGVSYISRNVPIFQQIPLFGFLKNLSKYPYLTEKQVQALTNESSELTHVQVIPTFGEFIVVKLTYKIPVLPNIVLYPSAASNSESTTSQSSPSKVPSLSISTASATSTTTSPRPSIATIAVNNLSVPSPTAASTPSSPLTSYSLSQLANAFFSSSPSQPAVALPVHSPRPSPTLSSNSSSSSSSSPPPPSTTSLPSSASSSSPPPHQQQIKYVDILLGCGGNSYRQFSGCPPHECLSFTPLNTSMFNDSRIIKIACAAMHIVVQTEDNQIWVCGNNKMGQLGFPKTLKEYTMFTKLVIPWFLVANTASSEAVYITKIEVGYSHTLFLLSNNKVIGFGYNKHGQLGVGNFANVFQPTIIHEYAEDVIGAPYFTIIKSSVNGEYYASGLNADGQLGIGTNASVSTFTRVLPPDNVAKEMKISQVAVAFYQSFYLTTDNEFYVCGRNNCDNFNLGHDNPLLKRTLVPLPAISSKEVVSMASSCTCNVAFITRNRELWMFGKNEYGENGNGSTKQTNELIRIQFSQYSQKVVQTVDFGRMTTYVLLKSAKSNEVFREDLKTFQTQLKQNMESCKQMKLCFPPQLETIRMPKYQQQHRSGKWVQLSANTRSIVADYLHLDEFLEAGPAAAAEKGLYSVPEVMDAVLLVCENLSVTEHANQVVYHFIHLCLKYLQALAKYHAPPAVALSAVAPSAASAAQSDTNPIYQQLALWITNHFEKIPTSLHYPVLTLVNQAITDELSKATIPQLQLLASAQQKLNFMDEQYASPTLFESFKLLYKLNNNPELIHSLTSASPATTSPTAAAAMAISQQNDKVLLELDSQGKYRVLCDKFVLCMHSPYFQAMFDNTFSESKRFRINLSLLSTEASGANEEAMVEEEEEDKSHARTTATTEHPEEDETNTKTMKQLLEFFYTGQMVVNESNAVGILLLWKDWSMSTKHPLFHICQQVIIYNLNTENVISIYKHLIKTYFNFKSSGIAPTAEQQQQLESSPPTARDGEIQEDSADDDDIELASSLIDTDDESFLPNYVENFLIQNWKSICLQYQTSILDHLTPEEYVQFNLKYFQRKSQQHVEEHQEQKHLRRLKRKGRGPAQEDG